MSGGEVGGGGVGDMSRWWSVRVTFEGGGDESDRGGRVEVVEWLVAYERGGDDGDGGGGRGIIEWEGGLCCLRRRRWMRRRRSWSTWMAFDNRVDGDRG
jgi:hypothetical protein